MPFEHRQVIAQCARSLVRPTVSLHPLLDNLSKGFGCLLLGTTCRRICPGSVVLNVYLDAFRLGARVLILQASLLSDSRASSL